MKKLFEKLFFWMQHLKKQPETNQNIDVEQQTKETPPPEVIPPKKAIPDRNDDVAEWEEFVKTADWEKIHGFFMKFVPMVNDDQDHAIWNVLHNRLCQLELPTLSHWFIKYHSKRIILVKQDSSVAQIKETVEEFWPSIKSPCFVLKSDGELVGFALSPTLIISGITPVACKAKNALQLVKDWNKELLTVDDCRLVEACFHQLNDLMQSAQVPTIKCSDWIIAVDEHSGKKTLKGYDINHEDRVIPYSLTDYTNILVKL